MHFSKSLMLCAAAALATAGCSVHEHVEGPAALQGEVAVDEPQGAVIEGPGVTAVDVEPDPAQRVYVYDEGYPPGTYIYDNYYYYGGYRYPHDVFVNQYVQENIRQHRYVNRDENRRQGQTIEQSQRAEFAKTHGVRQKPAGRADVQPRAHTPVRPPEAARPNVEHPENRAPANEEHRAVVPPAANRPPTNEERRPAVEQRPASPAPGNEERRRPAVEQRPASPAPANEERRPAVEQRPASPAPANEERRPAVEQRPASPAPAKEPAKPNPEEPKHEENK